MVLLIHLDKYLENKEFVTEIEIKKQTCMVTVYSGDKTLKPNWKSKSCLKTVILFGIFTFANYKL